MRLGVVEINSQEGVVNDEEWMPDIFRTSNSADVSRLEADIARPIHRFISGKSRSPGIDEHDFSGVRQYLEVISAIRRELRHGYLNKSIP